MNNSPLRFQMLEAPLLIKNYVTGDSLCNYEIYLKEIINASSWFAQYFPNSFCPPDNENSGECDVYSDNYGLDFKLIASKTALQAKSIHSFQIYKMMDGAYAFCGPKKSGNMTITRLPQALRGKTQEELLEARDNALKQQGINNDIKEYLDTIETKKNLLLYFPYRFSFDSPNILIDDIQSIIKACKEDFGVSLAYRAMHYPTLDTFFIFLYDYYFVVSKWMNNSFVLLDAVPVEKSDTFMHLSQTYCHEWSEKYDVTLQELRKKEAKK